MPTDQQTAHGIDLETLEGFAAHAAENPEAVQLGLEAAATYEGTAGTRLHARIARSGRRNDHHHAC